VDRGAQGAANAALPPATGQCRYQKDVQLCTSGNRAYSVLLWPVCCCV
jgi:hypothetical protein